MEKIETIVCKKCGRELPVSNFKVTRWGEHCHVCNGCVKESYKIRKKKDAERVQSEIESARYLKLKDFTPRELMVELKNRGYSFTMKYEEVIVRTIDSNHL